MSGTAAGPAERAADGRGPRPKLRPERLRELSLLAVIGVSVLVFSQLVDNYLSGSFFNRVTTSMAITAVLAAAQTIVILTRNIDLSVGSIVGVTAYCYVPQWGYRWCARIDGCAMVRAEEEPPCPSCCTPDHRSTPPKSAPSASWPAPGTHPATGSDAPG